MAISLEDLKKMSPRVMALLILVAYGLIGYFYYFFFLQSALHQRATFQTKLSELQREVTEKERIASQKTRFLQEVAALKVAFQEALNKLPDKREIQPLFQTVASLGKAAGLDFLLFQPKPPEPPPEPKAANVKDNIKPSDQRSSEQKPATGKAPPAPPSKALEPDKFYEEIPVTVSLSGHFHSTLSFFEKVATLPRIINIENISMGEGKKDIKGYGQLIKIDCVIKTYMFVDKPR
jgi:type IV pilus assembly protein PilO